MDIQEIERTIVFRLKNLCENGVNSIDYRQFLSWTGSRKLLANTYYGLLEDRNILRQIEKPTKEFLECLEEKKTDKRVKNVKKYCLQRHPIKIELEINCELLMNLWEYFNRNMHKLLPATFQFFVLFMYPE